jgi:lysophospholipase L1-like esterase
MKQKALIALMFTQILIIFYLGIKIYQEKSNILGVRIVAPVDEELSFFNRDSNFKYFYELKPGFSATLDNHLLENTTFKYTINKDTLNERFDYSISKPQDTFRIITLGDSHVFGFLVNTEDNWTEQLEDLLNNKNSCQSNYRFEVINLGVYGYDLQYSGERFRIRGQKYNPDLVIWMISAGDFLEITEYTYPQMVYLTNKLKESGDYESYIEKGEYKSLNMAVDMFLEKFGPENVIKTTTNFLYEFDDLYQGALLITSPPRMGSTYKEILLNFTNSRNNTFYSDKLMNVFDENNLLFPDKHPNEKGHLIIANDIFEYLETTNLIPCE